MAWDEAVHWGRCTVGNWIGALLKASVNTLYGKKPTKTFCLSFLFWKKFSKLSSFPSISHFHLSIVFLWLIFTYSLRTLWSSLKITALPPTRSPFFMFKHGYSKYCSYVVHVHWYSKYSQILSFYISSIEDIIHIEELVLHHQKSRFSINIKWYVCATWFSECIFFDEVPFQPSSVFKSHL